MQLLDEYMVSVAYVDRILAEIQGMAACYAERPVALIYFADHGEELYDRRGGGHNPATFTWLSEGYRERYPEKLDLLNSNAAKVFTNDYIYTLFLGLAHIDTASYDPEFDPGSAAYSLTPENAVIFNGRKISEDPGLAR